MPFPPTIKASPATAATVLLLAVLLQWPQPLAAQATLTYGNGTTTPATQLNGDWNAAGRWHDGAAWGDWVAGGTARFFSPAGGANMTITLGSAVQLGGMVKEALENHWTVLSQAGHALNFVDGATISVNNNTLATQGGAVTGNNLQVTGTTNGTVRIGPTGGEATANNISGLSLDNITLKLSKANGVAAVGGAVVVNSGVLEHGARFDNRRNNQYAPGSTLTIKGGTVLYWNTAQTLDSFAYHAGTFTIWAGANLNLGGTDALTLRNVTLTRTGGSAGQTYHINLTRNGAQTVRFDAANNGTATMTEGTALVLGGGEKTLHVENGNATTDMRMQSMSVTETLPSSLRKSGAGHLMLGSTSAYTGGTTVAEGTLLLATASARPPAGTISVADGASLALRRHDGHFTTEDFAALHAGTLAGTVMGPAALAGWENNGANPGLLDAPLAGTRGLEKLGAGTLVLAADNTYTGPTKITQGILQLGDGGATGSLAGDVQFVPSIDGFRTLRFNRGGTLVHGGAIGGPGSVVKDGPGTVVFTGDCTYTGPTTVVAGYLEISNAVFTAVLSPNSLAVDFHEMPSNGDHVILPGGIGGDSLANATVTVGGSYLPGVVFTNGSSLEVNVNVQPPSGLSYTPAGVSGMVGMEIPLLTPSVTGSPTSYAVTPSLSPGLALDPVTGVISGTPLAVSAPASYTVTASNSVGGATAEVLIGIYPQGSSSPTLTVAADAHVNGNNPDDNYGTLNRLAIRSTDRGGHKAYLLFDASERPGAIGRVENLQVVYGSEESRSLTAYVITGDGVAAWTESGLTWNNAPGNNVTGTSREFSPYPGQKLIELGSVTGSSPGEILSIPITAGSVGEIALLEALNTGDRKATIGVRYNSPESSAVIIYSRERDGGVHAATLSTPLNYDPVPPGHPMSDRAFFARINLEQPGLEQVRDAVLADNLPEAKAALAAYYRLRSGAFHTVDSRHPAAAVTDPAASLAAAQELVDRTGAWDASLWDGDTFDWERAAMANKERMDFFSTFGQAAAVENGEAAAQSLVHLVRSFVSQYRAPATGRGGGMWATLATGIRLRSGWPDAFCHLLNSSPTFTDDDVILFLKSVWEQTDYVGRNLSETSNWLTFETAGLYASGTVYPEFRDAEAWRRLACETIDADLARGWLPDGMSIEKSASYGAFFSNYFHVHRTAALTGRLDEFASGVVALRDFPGRTEHLFDAYLRIMAPDRGTPVLNDGGPAQVPAILASGLEFFPNRDDFRWVATDGAAGAPPAFTTTTLPYAGYMVMRSGWGRDDNYLLFDAGGVGYRHAHQDKLHLVLWAYGRQILFDSSQTTAAGADPAYENFFRDTYSHSTGLVDDRPQRRPWYSDPHPDMMPYRPVPDFRHDIRADGTAWAAGAYAGDYGLPGSRANDSYPYGEGSVFREGWSKPAGHQREVMQLAPDLFVVKDWFVPDDDAAHDYEVRWQVDSTAVLIDGLHAVTADPGVPNLAIRPLDTDGLSVAAASGVLTADEIAGWKNDNGTLRPATTLRHRKSGAGPRRFLTLLHPLRAGETAAGLTHQIAPDGRITIRTPDGRHFALDPAPTYAGSLAQLTGLEAWRQQWFGGAGEDAPTGDMESFSGDASPNLMKYAFGLDPTRVAAPAELPRVGVAPDAGDDHLSLRFLRQRDATDVLMRVLASDDLADWSEAIWDSRFDPPGAWTGPTEEIEVLDPVPMNQHPAGMRFLRLEVSRLRQNLPEFTVQVAAPPAGDATVVFEEALRRIREAAETSDIGTAVVSVAPGNYRFDRTLVINPPMLGRFTGQLVIAATGDGAVLSGSTPVAGWRPSDHPSLPAAAQGLVWEADLPPGLAPKVLYDGTGLLPRSRSAGFSPAATEATRTTFTGPTDLLPAGTSLAGVELSVRPHHLWVHNILPLASYDPATGAGTTALPATYPISRVADWTGGFVPASAWLENHPALISQPGRWAVDPVAGKLYLWPRDGQSPTGIRAARLIELLRLDGDEAWEMPLANVTLRGLTFSHAERESIGPDDAGLQHDWDFMDKGNAMLRLRWVENITVENCHFAESGAAGLRADLHAQNVRVTGNTFRGLGGGGILFCGYGPGTKDLNKNNEIHGNLVEDCGRLIWHSPGIHLWQSGDNMVTRNLVRDMPYTGIIVSGVGAQFFRNAENPARELERTIRWGEVPLGPNYTTTTIQPYLHTRYNLVAGNEITGVMRTMGDGNGIYIRFSSQTGNVIRGNYVHNITGPRNGGGIRCDGEQNGVTIEGNYIRRVNFAGISINGRNTIRNNFLVDILNRDNSTAQESPIVRACIQAVNQPNSAGAVIQRNVFLQTTAGTPEFYHLSFSAFLNPPPPPPVLEDFVMGENLYWVEGNPGHATDFVADLHSRNIDPGSLAADPADPPGPDGLPVFRPQVLGQLQILPFNRENAGLP